MPECPGCNMAVTGTASFCPGCGTEIQSPDQSPEAVEESDTTRHSMFYIGAVLGVLGVLLFPYFFFLVALPEAILQMKSGRSVLDSLSSDASQNPAMRGTFLIFRWFGNFLILAFVLGVILGILILLASL